MPDSIAVLPPGWRATDTNNALVTDGFLEFFAAGPSSSPLPVFANSALTTALGAVVACNSVGTPVTSGNVPTLIYTSSAPYRVRLTSAIYGGTVWEYDNVLAALNTTGFLTSAFTPSQPEVSTSASLAVGASSKGKLINVNCSAADLTMTLDDPATLGDGWWVMIRHNGNANRVRILAGAGNFALVGATTTSFALTGKGHTVTIGCDGSGFTITNEVPALIGNTIGVIRILDRLSAPPGAPAAGDRYIVTAAPTGLWSTFAEHDIAEAAAGGWFKYTPPANAGWHAFVVDEGLVYTFRSGAWISSLSTTTIAGISISATQAVMELAASFAAPYAASPATQHFHPGHGKFFGFGGVGVGVPVLQASYGVSSVTDAAVGIIYWNLTTAFSSLSYAVTGTCWAGSTSNPIYATQNVGQSAVLSPGTCTTGGGGFVDPGAWNAVGYGDQ